MIASSSLGLASQMKREIVLECYCVRVPRSGAFARCGLWFLSIGNFIEQISDGACQLSLPMIDDSVLVETQN